MNFSDFNEEQFTESNNDNSSAEAPTPQESEEKQEEKKEKKEKKIIDIEEEIRNARKVLEEIEIKRKKGAPKEKIGRAAKEAKKRVRLGKLVNEADSLLEREEQLNVELKAKFRKPLQRELEKIENRREKIIIEMKELVEDLETLELHRR